MASISKDTKGLRRILFVGADGKRGAVYLGKLPQKAAEAISTKIEAIVAARVARISIDKETADWIGGLDAILYSKLAAVGLIPKRAEAERATLAGFIDGYVSQRADVKGSTATAYGNVRRCLVDYFGPAKPLAEITPGDCDAWRIWLGRHEKLSENTVKRRCGIAKQFFRAAQRRKLLGESPFADMKATSVNGNHEREFFVTREMARRVLDACPDTQWRLLFALSRYGGLRCPSEHLALRWGDVDWERGRIRVSSPKTEHHEGGAFRWLPIFPELRPHLEAAWEQAEPGTEYVITRYRDANSNLRTQLERIIAKAGLEPWPKLFQNLRSTRQTELAEHFPAHVVCQWIGNSQAVAREHYLQVTDEHFKRATQNPTQQASVSARIASHTSEAIVGNVGKTAISRHIANCKVGPPGLEPGTKGL